MEREIELTAERVELFCRELRRQERSEGTIRQYRSNLLHLMEYLGANVWLSKENLLVWKAEMTRHRSAATVNCMIAAVNAYLIWAGHGELKLKSLKCQRRVFSENELTREDFRYLVERAREQGDECTAMLLFALAGTGVRVSEVQFLTVEAAQQRMAVIRLKGKTRQIPLGDRLSRELLAYAEAAGIECGPLFQNRYGAPLDRRRVWDRLKGLCAGTDIDPERVHPHALRHLFARMFYDLTRDIAKLADLLGHSSIETTRIYVMTSCEEHRSVLDRLTGSLEV